MGEGGAASIIPLHPRIIGNVIARRKKVRRGNLIVIELVFGIRDCFVAPGFVFTVFRSARVPLATTEVYYSG
jgi:hypothetical protein